MKNNDKVIYESFIELKDLMRSQGCTVEVFDKLEQFDGKLLAREVELREIKSKTQSKGKIKAIQEILGEC